MALNTNWVHPGSEALSDDQKHPRYVALDQMLSHEALSANQGSASLHVTAFDQMQNLGALESHGQKMNFEVLPKGPPSLEATCFSKLHEVLDEQQTNILRQVVRHPEVNHQVAPYHKDNPSEEVPLLSPVSPKGTPRAPYQSNIPTERFRDLMKMLSQEFDKMRFQNSLMARENAELRKHMDGRSARKKIKTKSPSRSPRTPLTPDQHLLSMDWHESGTNEFNGAVMMPNSSVTKLLPLAHIGSSAMDDVKSNTVSYSLHPVGAKLNSDNSHMQTSNEEKNTTGRGSVRTVDTGFISDSTDLKRMKTSLVGKKMTPRVSTKTVLEPTGVLSRNIITGYEKKQKVEESLSKKRAKMKETPRFDLFMGCLILANAFVMAVGYQVEGYKAASSAGIEPTYTESEGGKLVFEILDHFFCIVFTLEILLRTYWHGWIHFAEPLGVFELMLVALSLIELYVLKPANLDSGTNFTVLRITRLFRFMRVMRIVRVFSLFSSLRVLCKTIASCIQSLVWAMLLLLLIVCSAGLVACQLINEYITDTAMDLRLRTWLFLHYGTSTRSIYSLFEATLSGCWPNYARPLVDDISGLWSLFWLFYAAFVVFAIISVIRAIFLKETLQNASADADTMIQEQMLKKNAYREKLSDAFDAIDVEGNGEITREDFELIMQVPKVQALMAVLDFEVHDGSVVFHMLEEDNDGTLTYAEFLNGIMRLRGTARQLDVVSIQRDCRLLMEAVLKLTEAFETTHGVNIPNKVQLEAMSACMRAAAATEEDADVMANSSAHSKGERD